MTLSTNKNRTQVKDYCSEPCSLLTEQEGIKKLQKGQQTFMRFRKMAKTTINFVVGRSWDRTSLMYFFK